jgi:uncharacterized protein (TIGR02145 family)
MICAASLTAGLALVSACGGDDPVEPAKLNVSPATITATADGGASTITVDANRTWTAVSDDTEIAEVTGKTDNSFVIDVAQNTSETERTTTVTVSGGDLSKTVTVTQAGKGVNEVLLKVTPASADVAAAGGTSSFTIESNGAWAVTSNQTWATVSPASGSDNGTITVTSEVNEGAARTATIAVKAGDKTVNVTVKQASGAGCPTISDLTWVEVTTFPLVNTGKYIDKAQVLPCESALTLFGRTDAIPYKFTLTEAGTLSIEERNTKCGVYIYADLAKVGNMSNTPDHGLVNHGDNGAWNPPISACTVTPGTYYVLVFYRRDSDGDGDAYQLDLEVTFTPDNTDPTEPTEVTINGVTWSTRNVGEPGQFVATMNDLGKLYKFNSKVPWDIPTSASASAPAGWDNTQSAGTNNWLRANDPCPAGWHVPDMADYETSFSGNGFGGAVWLDGTAKDATVPGGLVGKTNGNGCIWCDLTTEASSATSIYANNVVFFPYVPQWAVNGTVKDYYEKNTRYWTATAAGGYDNLSAYRWFIFDNMIDHGNDANDSEQVKNKGNAYPVRCVKGEGTPDPADPTLQDFVVPGDAAVGQTWDLKDTRDEQIYPVVKMADGKVWLAKNLNFTQGLTETSDYLCQDGHCDRWGVHYGWSAAQTVCPTGWHVPTRPEADALSGALSAKYGDGSNVIAALALPNDPEAGFDYWSTGDGGIATYNNDTKFNGIGSGSMYGPNAPDHFPRLSRSWVNQGKFEFGFGGGHWAVEGFSPDEYFTVRCIKD